MEANILLAKCPRSHSTFGMRVEKRGGDWVRTWAFKIKEESAVKEGFDKTKIEGSFDAVDEYPGCPYCGSYGFIVCGRCGKISCYSGDGRTAECEWCGNRSEITLAETLTADSGQF